MAQGDPGRAGIVARVVAGAEGESMKLNKAEVGERYGDDSGWERRVSIDIQGDRAEFEANGSDMVCSVADAKWLYAALGEVIAALEVP
jgi:hypothetical protein